MRSSRPPSPRRRAGAWASVLPAMERLTDAVARGYWHTVIRREEESRGLYENVVQPSSDGIFEVDLDGRVLFANPSLALILGQSVEDIQGAVLSDVLAPL